MYILLNKVVQYGNIFSYSVFDTDTLGVREVQNLNNVYYTNLDNYYNMDIFSCELNGSGGISAKFFGRTLDNKYYGMVKFARAYNIDGSDVINEVVIYELGKLLGVSVCKAILGKVGNCSMDRR